MVNNKIKEEHKWGWMMEYCRKNYLPPAESWAWKKAEKSYEEMLEELNKKGENCFRK